MINLIIGITLMFISGFIFARNYYGAFNNDNLPITLLIIAIGLCFIGSYQMLQNSHYIVDALNNTLQYDTIYVNNNGELVKIKIK